MFSTSLVTAAVAVLVAPGAPVGLPTWQPDYRTALAQSAEQHKPVAVFIAHGKDGHSKLVTSGGIGADAAKVLKQSYVCLYVDTDTNAGKELSRAFGMTEGLVISDKSGGAQALRHDGNVTRSDLTGYLTRFADPAAVSQTEYRVGSQPAAVAVQPAPLAAQPVYQPAYQPVYQPQAVFSPAVNFRSFYGGS